MAELFFSYSAKDRERVRPIYEALAALGFDVSWDQLVPAGWDWDTWIREQLADARCVVVFWSLGSVASDNIRHEATIAKEQGKIVPVMLDALRVGQFPMGLFNTQAARLIEWSGDGDDPEWRKLLTEIESKLMPVWAARRIARLDAELKAEGRRRETAQAGEDAAEAQLAQEIAKQGQLRRDRERAQADTETARAELSGVKEALDAAKAQNSDMAERLASAEKLAASGRKRFPVPAFVAGVLLALTVGASVVYFAQEAAWTKREAAAVIEAMTKAEAETRQIVEAEARERAEAAERATAAAEAGRREAGRLAAEAQQRRAVREAELQRVVRETEQSRVVAEAQERQKRAEREAEQQRAAREAEQERIAREARERELALTEQRRRILQNTALHGALIKPNPIAETAEGCRNACVNDSRCKGFEFAASTVSKICWNYSTITRQYTEVGRISGRWD